ncbi:MULTISPECIES: putative cytokinetic ring protein SteA [unclassified Micromonospora]|uniref:putative cytokinetic ring protein SteA n=1 Tax=Micromonospora TaxID=1873 RepID=UPI0022B6759D|nr:MULTISPECIES: putative cytokinetic ring protein SteA [unclassified Micromonospora]MCZ7418020.1 putative cytokinetic ring protein SteA [Verrucosispora sp. WMMA2121]MCZ7422085.1 putative cytokinetic ring protein SteA [Verrucosispora sp. WMMA2121]WBB89824.1 putative cytokinetic ring protein SteA [Verrucosispora sp. WMMC514]
MRLPTLRRARNAEPGQILGTARLDRRTKRLVGRLRPGDIAVIDHVDLDRVAADSLVAVGVGAVLNAKPSVSGRYPNLGPEVLISAGIPLLDDLGEGVFERIREGDTVRIEGNTVYLDDDPVAHGSLQDAESVAKAMTDAREGLSVQLEAFAANTMDYLKQERDLLLDGVGVPEIATEVQGRHCLIVVRGYDYKADLDVLRPYIREFKPVLIGVDGGADALVEAGYTPDMIIGDMDSVTDDVLRCGAEVIVHAYPDGRAPGLPRVNGLGVPAVTFPAAATSEDLAMLLADEKGASLIVAVGTHATLVEFLDKGRGGMASTFLTRLKVGGKLVDAKGVSRLYRQSISGSSLLLLVLSALAAMASAVAVSTVGKAYLGVVSEWWDNFVFQLGQLF